ncbi:MAG TPA: response regulator [Rhizobiaceae bacterium]
MSHMGVVSIVDDDDSVRTAMGKLLRPHGYLVHSFASADEFLRSLAVDETQCLISDIRMPGMTGLELQARLIALGRKMAVIFVTAFPEDKARQQALAAGAYCYLGKPFDGAVLTRFVELALSESG